MIPMIPRINGIEKNKIHQDRGNFVCAKAGCYLTREAAQLTFKKYGRSMIASQIIELIPTAFEKLESSVQDCIEWRDVSRA